MMFVSLTDSEMGSLDGGFLIKSACDILSKYGISNFIHWDNETTVDLFDCNFRVMVDYVAGGVHFLDA